MKKLVRTLVVLALVALASFASAQTIKPRRPGAPAKPAVTAPAATPAPTVAPPPSASPSASPTPPAPADESEATPPVTLESIQEAINEVRGSQYDISQIESKLATTKAKLAQAEDAHNKTKAELGATKAELENYKEWYWWYKIAITTSWLVTLFTIAYVMRKRRKVASVFILLTLGLTAQAQAATTTPTCTIRAISDGGVVVKEQEAAPISISVRNCGEVKGVVVDENTTVVVKKSTATRITAEVVAGADAIVGPTSFKLVLADNSEVESPDSVSLLVLEPATAQVRKDLKQEISATSKEVTAMMQETASSLNKKIDAVAMAATTNEKVNTLLEEKLRPILEKIATLEKIDAAQQGQIEEIEGNLDETMGATQSLAEGQARLAKKKTGLRRKPTDSAVGEFADRIATKMAAVRAKIALARQKARGEQ